MAQPASKRLLTESRLGVDIATVVALSGKADLSGGKLSAAQLPDLAISDFLGTVANQTAMLALTGQKGDWCARSDTSTVWVISGNTPTNVSSWTQMVYPSAGTVADGSVTTAKLANDSVTGDKLSPYVEDAVTKALSAVQPNTAPTFAGQRLNVGAPASGKVWSATDTLGNGEWASGANVELAYAEIGAESPIANTATDIPGLSVTFATTDRPAMIKAYMSGVQGTGDGTWQFQLVRTSDSAVLALGICNTTASPSVAYPPAPTLELRIPAGTASTTYKVQAYRVAGTATGGKINPANKKAFIQAVSV